MVKIPPDKIRSWVISHFPEHKERKDGQQLVIRNPFGHNDKLKFNINVEEGICHDWRGDSWTRGGGASFLRFVQLYKSCSFSQAIKEVGGSTTESKFILDARYRSDQGRVDNDVIITLPDSSARITQSPYSVMKKLIFNWLDRRGITLEMINRYDLWHDLDHVIWPYYEYGELVYWQSRSIVNKIFNYPKDTKKGEFIYGFDAIEPRSYIILTEAIIDAMTVGSQCVAIGGATLANRQIRKLDTIEPSKGIILAPDNDKAGINSLSVNYDMLRDKYLIYYVLPPDGIKDWNEMGQSNGFRQVRAYIEHNIKPLTLSTIVNFR